MFCKLSLILIFDMWLILSLLHLQGRDFSAFIVWYVVQIKETCFSEAISAWKHIFIILGIFSFHWTKHLLKTFHIFGKASLLFFSVVLLNQARLPLFSEFSLSKLSLTEAYLWWNSWLGHRHQKNHHARIFPIPTTIKAVDGLYLSDRNLRGSGSGASI